MSNQDIDKALVILQKTHDGDDLSPTHLKILEMYVNGHLNEKGLREFEKIYESVANGTYVQPWHLGVEHMTYDHEGYIYFKGRQVEHYSRHWAYSLDAKRQLIQLQQYCLFLESRGEKIGGWPWAKCGWTHQGKYAEAFAQSKQAELDTLMTSDWSVLFSHIKVLTGGGYESFLMPGHPSKDEVRASDEFRDLVLYETVDESNGIEVSTYAYGEGRRWAHATPEELGIIDLCFDYLKDRELAALVSEDRYGARESGEQNGGDYGYGDDEDECER